MKKIDNLIINEDIEGIEIIQAPIASDVKVMPKNSITFQIKCRFRGHWRNWKKQHVKQCLYCEHNEFHHIPKDGFPLENNFDNMVPGIRVMPWGSDMSNEELEEEVKRKQAYLKDSKYIEIQIETSEEGAGDFIKYEDTTKFVPSTRKPSVSANEIGSNSNDWCFYVVKFKKASNILASNHEGKNNPMYGRKHTEISKLRMRSGHLGQVSPNKGKHLNKKTKQKMSLSHKDIKLKRETKERISKSLQDIVHTKEWSHNISLAKKGEKHSSEHVRKQKETWKQMIKNGYCLTEEHKEKIRLARMRQILPINDTSIERKVKLQLKKLNVDFMPQWNLGNKFLCDFYVPSLDLIIECDGDYWHSIQSNINNDKRKNAYASKCGHKMLRISEKVINMNNFNISHYLREN